jgi:DivIVA domain-containing protein
MLTPQDIREKTFEKAMFGGYDMGSVDDFLETAANDLTLLQKENATLKGKMKVLVDKIEEYRTNEDALRMAILSAQKMGNMIEKEARDKSEKMVGDAMQDAARITKEASLEVDVEKARLAEAKRASAQFIDNMNLLCRKQLDFLAKLSQTDFMTELKNSEIDDSDSVREYSSPRADGSSEIHETVKSIEETVAKAANAPVSDVRPNIRGMVSGTGDEDPTRAYSIVSDSVPGDAGLEKTMRFSLDDRK